MHAAKEWDLPKEAPAGTWLLNLWLIDLLRQVHSTYWSMSKLEESGCKHQKNACIKSPKTWVEPLANKTREQLSSQTTWDYSRYLFHLNRSCQACESLIPWRNPRFSTQAKQLLKSCFVPLYLMGTALRAQHSVFILRPYATGPRSCVVTCNFTAYRSQRPREVWGQNLPNHDSSCSEK